MVFLLQGDFGGGIISFLFIIALIMIYPRLMLSNLIYKIEQSAIKIEGLSRRANVLAARKANAKSSKEIRNKVNEFTDFFIVEPSSIDPYGLVRKIDATIRSMETRFTEFSNEIGSGLSKDEKQELNYALRAAIGLRQISKIVRHFVETAKKFKNLQIAMIIQMQLPIIEKIAEAELKGTEAFANGWPIGDSIGPLVAASFMNSGKNISDGIVYDKITIEGRKCFVLKATGPAPHLGRIDEAIENIMKKNKIARIITVDAAGKLEGEKSGSVAEGVGFAMGGIGQREMIENILLPKNMSIDSIVVKVGMHEAIMPMRKDIFNSLQKTRTSVIKAVKRAGKKNSIIIIGVGNSSGIGNSKKTVNDVKNIVDKTERKYKAEQEKNKKRKWI